MKTMLLFFSDEGVNSRSAVIPTLSWLSEQVGVDFENYICTTPFSYGGEMLALNGNLHMQQFLYLANFYDKIVYCALTSRPGYQFRREVLAFGGDVICCRGDGELAEFYQDVFAYFKQAIPAQAVILPNDTPALSLAPFCYPEVLFDRALGVTQREWNVEKFAALGVSQVGTLYCAPDTGNLPHTEIDALRPQDTYGTVTDRIAARWIDHCKGVGFSNPSGLTRWAAMYCREKVLCMYQPTDWKAFIPAVVAYSRRIGNDVIIGNQMVEPVTDDVCTEVSKYGMVMNLVGVNPRLGFTLQSKHPLPVDWLTQAKAPWEDEYSDEFLLQKIKEHAIPVCFLFYAADLGHLPTLPRFIDLMGIEGMRAGIAFPSLWYEYEPELLEQLYIPRRLGGVFPQLEPLISSGGISVVTECKGFISPELLTDSLKRAKKQIADSVGPRMTPIGYYPFQDCDPYYKYGTGEPQYEAVEKAGFDYYVSYVDMNTPARILAQVNDMTVINQQTRKWFPGSSSARNQSRGFLMEWEEKTPADANDWIVMTYDAPFFGDSPLYMGWMESLKDGMFESTRKLGMQSIMEAMQYVRNGGGQSGRLFMLKPHELVRYARLLKKAGRK